SAEVMSLFDGSTTLTSSTLSTPHNIAHAMIWRRNGIALTLRENKIDRSGGAPTSGLTLTMDRVGIANSFFAPLAGDIGEIITYNQFRNDAECDNLFDHYLQPKWGIGTVSSFALLNNNTGTMLLNNADGAT